MTEAEADEFARGWNALVVGRRSTPYREELQARVVSFPRGTRPFIQGFLLAAQQYGVMVL